MRNGNPYSSGSVEVKVDAPPPRGGHIVPPPPASRRVSPLPAPADPIRRHPRTFKRWAPWLVPSFVVANVLIFIITMYVNNCPKNDVAGSCFPNFLGRFSFQPLKENPLFGPSSSTWASFLSPLAYISCCIEYLHCPSLRVIIMMGQFRNLVFSNLFMIWTI